MRSFHLLSFTLFFWLLSSSPGQAQHSYGHEKSRVRHRHINNLSSTFDAKHKRDNNVAFTYFDDGLGACGATNGPNDFIVALNSAEYDGGTHCFEMIAITVNGKTAQAQITDECPTCAVGGLDFSRGLFEYFAPLSNGVIYGSWSYNSGATSSSTSYYTPTPTTTVATTMATTSSSTASSTITTSVASTAVPSSTSISATTVPTSAPQDPQIIMQINLAILDLGSLLSASLNL